MTIKEVSAYLRIPVSTIYDLAGKGKIRGVKFGKHWRFLEEDILHYLHYGDRGYPAHDTRSTEKRESFRVNSEIPAGIAVQLNGRSGLLAEGTIANLSEGGAFFVYTENGGNGNGTPAGGARAVPGDPVKLVFRMTEQAPSKLEVDGLVIHQGAGPRTGAGIKFRHLSQENREMIKKHVE